MSPRRRHLVAGIVLLFGVVYLAFEAIAAAAWVDPVYDWAGNYISDLGFSDCAIVDGSRICSPLHPLMNAGFFVQGTVFIIGSVLAVGLMLPAGWKRTLTGALLVLSGAGTFLVGVFHQSVELYSSGLNWMHVLVAFLAIGPGNVGILLLGALVIRDRRWRGYGVAVAAVGVVGIVSALFLVADNDLGVGIGLVERFAVYPLNAWTIGTGVFLLARAARNGRATEGRAALVAGRRAA